MKTDQQLVSIKRQIVVVSPHESLFRREVRGWVAKSIGHWLIDYLGHEVLERNEDDSITVHGWGDIGYISEVRAERWFDHRTERERVIYVAGSDRDVVIALIDANWMVSNTINACPERGPRWAYERDYMPVVLGKAWDGSDRIFAEEGMFYDSKKKIFYRIEA